MNMMITPTPVPTAVEARNILCNCNTITSFKNCLLISSLHKNDVWLRTRLWIRHVQTTIPANQMLTINQRGELSSLAVPKVTRNERAIISPTLEHKTQASTMRAACVFTRIWRRSRSPLLATAALPLRDVAEIGSLDICTRVCFCNSPKCQHRTCISFIWLAITIHTTNINKMSMFNNNTRPTRRCGAKC